MPKLPINEIEDGMVLANPIIGATGNILLPQGSTLKKSMTARLMTWKIHFVEIVGEDLNNNLNPIELKDHLFKLNTSNSEHQICILNAIVKYRTKQDGNNRKPRPTFRQDR